MTGTEYAPLQSWVFHASRLFYMGFTMLPEMPCHQLLHSKTRSCFSSCKNISWREGSGYLFALRLWRNLSLCQMLFSPQKLQRRGFRCVGERLWPERGCLAQQSPSS